MLNRLYVWGGRSAEAELVGHRTTDHQRSQRLSEITAEQNRIRENMKQFEDYLNGLNVG